MQGIKEKRIKYPCVYIKKMNTLGEFDNKGLIAWWY